MILLNGSRLYRHVQQFASAFGPRPAGGAAETAARAALEQYLHQRGIHDTLHLPFSTANTWGYGTIAPLLGALAAQLIPRANRFVRAACSLFGAQQFWLTISGRMREQPCYRLYPQFPGGTLVARIPAAETAARTVVLIGHTDTNKHRLTFSPALKRSLRLSSTSLLLSALANALASALGARRLRLATAAYLAVGVASMLADEAGAYVEGANDNGSAMACVLGLGEQALATPLATTDLWLVFTGSEEVSHDGLNVFLDRFGPQLQDAYFIDFEMVGKGSIHYVERYGGLIYFTRYAPDAASLRLATRAATRHAELHVSGREVVLFDEVATLRRRGFRGITLVGVERDGFPANWHQRTDRLAAIEPQALARAAQFAWRMIEDLERQ